MEVGWGGVSGGGVEWGWWWVGVGLVGVDEGVASDPRNLIEPFFAFSKDITMLKK